MMTAAVLAQVDMRFQQDMLSEISARSSVTLMGTSSSSLQPKSSQGLPSFYLDMALAKK